MEMNSIICGDSIEVLKDIDDDSIDMVITSPPYDNMRVYNGSGYDFEVFKKQALELTRVLKKGGVIVWIVRDQTSNGSESGSSFRQALFFKDECGLNIHDTMIYAKNHFVPLTHNRYEQQFEYMFILSKGRPKTFNGLRADCDHKGETVNPKWDSATATEKGCALRSRDNGEYVIKDTKLRPNIWWYSPSKKLESDNIAFKHPAIFPYELAYDHILSWSNEGDIILDPMCGSGTTPVIAKMLNRKYIGIDICEEYTNICNTRLDQI